MRTSAIYERSRSIRIVLTVTVLITIGTGIWSLTGSTTGNSDLQGCVHLFVTKENTQLIAAWSGVLFFDSTIFCLTLYKSLRLWRSGCRRLVHIIITDGTAYYLVLGIANLSNLLSYVFAPPVLKGVSSIFSNTVSVALVTRLLINIQNPASFEQYISNDLSLATFNAVAFHHSSITTDSSLSSGPHFARTLQQGDTRSLV